MGIAHYTTRTLHGSTMLAIEHLRAVFAVSAGTYREDLGVLLVAPQAARAGRCGEELLLRTARGVDGLAVDAAAADA